MIFRFDFAESISTKKYSIVLPEADIGNTPTNICMTYWSSVIVHIFTHKISDFSVKNNNSSRCFMFSPLKTRPQKGYHACF